MQNNIKQPYPWLEAFGFRIADRVSTLETTGQWTFKKADGRPATDTADAAVSTSDDLYGQLVWTDAAKEENDYLRTQNHKSSGDNKLLKEENMKLRRQLKASEYEKRELQSSLKEEKDKMAVRSRVARRPSNLWQNQANMFVL